MEVSNLGISGYENSLGSLFLVDRFLLEYFNPFIPRFTFWYKYEGPTRNDSSVLEINVENFRHRYTLICNTDHI